MAILQIVNTAALAVAVAVAGGAFAPEPTDREPTAAEIAYPGAPDGVDPMVTGPVSAEFRARQEQASCGAARWPEIPLDCFPK